MFGQMPQAIPQTPVPTSSPAFPLQAQAMALASRLSPQTNMQRMGGQPGGMSPGQAHPNAWVPTPYRPGQNAGGGVAPSVANQPGYGAQVPATIGRWTSPQSGSALG
jgi:hypothetical protein